MTRRQIWIFNYITTAAIVASGIWIFSQPSSNPSDKDIIAIYLAIALGIYLIQLTYIFYDRIYIWGIKGRKLFYFMTLPAVATSCCVLFVIVTEEDFKTDAPIVIGFILCSLNVITYLWGLIEK